MQKKAHVSVKASAKKGGAKKGGGKIRHMIIRAAKNGMISETHRMPGKGEDMYSQEPETNVHPDMDHLVDHMQGMAGEFGPEESAEENEERSGARALLLSGLG